jgi:predicted AAA+ superfamily ATPase
LFPFSFGEFLTFQKLAKPNFKRLTTADRGNLQRILGEYLTLGGIPDALKYPKLTIHQTLYDDVLYRDVASRYQISELQALKELTFYLLSNVSTLISFNKLKNWLKLGSVNTVRNYIEYLKTAWLFFTLNTYAPSVRKQEIAPKKIYGIDTGLVKSIAFSFSENRGKLLENLVFLSLRRKLKEIYYYKTKTGKKVDFYLPRSRQLIQVAQNLAGEEVLGREMDGLREAMGELKINSGLILTEGQKGLKAFGRVKIYIQPIYEWLN